MATNTDTPTQSTCIVATTSGVWATVDSLRKARSLDDEQLRNLAKFLEVICESEPQAGFVLIRDTSGDLGAPRQSSEDVAPLDFDALESQARAYAIENGIDLDSLFAAASSHFSSATFAPRSRPLSDVELDVLNDEDQRVLND